MILNFMSYARGDFYVKTVRTGLRDNQIIIPLTADTIPGGLSWELWWISYALVDHSCHSGAHGNRCTAQNTSCPSLWRGLLETLCVSKGRWAEISCGRIQGKAKSEMFVYNRSSEKKIAFSTLIIRWNPLVFEPGVLWLPWIILAIIAL